MENLCVGTTQLMRNVFFSFSFVFSIFTREAAKATCNLAMHLHLANVSQMSNILRLCS